MKKSSTGDCLEHYSWGTGCEGWVYVNEKELSVKEESMPPHSSEKKHVHQHAQQFFYILSGEAVFEVNGSRQRVEKGAGIHILPGETHRILNEREEPLVFILCSQPNTLNDRVDKE